MQKLSVLGKEINSTDTKKKYIWFKGRPHKLFNCMEERNMQWLNSFSFLLKESVSRHSLWSKEIEGFLCFNTFANLGTCRHYGTGSVVLTCLQCERWSALALKTSINDHLFFCNLISSLPLSCSTSLGLLWSVEFGGNEDTLPSLSVLELCHDHAKDKNEHPAFPDEVKWSNLTSTICQRTLWRSTQLPSWATVIYNHIIKPRWNYTHTQLTITSWAIINTFKMEFSISIFIPISLNSKPPLKMGYYDNV